MFLIMPICQQFVIANLIYLNVYLHVLHMDNWNYFHGNNINGEFIIS